MHPVLEVADIFRRHGAAFRAAQGSSDQRRVRPSRHAAQRRSAAMSSGAATAAWFASPTTAVAIGTVQSAKHSRAPSGSRIARPICCRSPISMSFSPCRRPWPPSRCRTRRWSTTAQDGSRDDPSHQRGPEASRCRDRDDRHSPYLGPDPDAEPSLKIPGIIISLIFSEQRKLVFRATPCRTSL
jgi:hypothetical protein